MKVLLIWPKGMIGEDYFIFPIALGYIKNSIEHIVEECRILDCSLDNITPEQLIEHAKGYDVIGISTWGFNIKNVQETIDIIKTSSDAIVVAGGPSSQLANADYVILGEGEIAFRAFIGKLLNGDVQTLTEIAGVFDQRKDAQFPKKYHDNLDDFGMINYEELQLDRCISRGYRYWMLSLKDKFRTAPIIATRGCPYHCSYCEAPLIMGQKLRKHSIDHILNTIKILINGYAIRQISFLDDNLTFDLDYAKRLCDAIILLKEQNNYEFILTTNNGVKVNRLDEELIVLMKKAGWSEIVLAPESASPRTLSRMRKKIDLDDVYNKVDLIHKHRMNVAGFFIYAFPGDQKEDLNLTKEYILNSKFDRCITSPFQPIPGTSIYDELVRSGEITDAIPDTLDYRAVKYIPQGLQLEDLREFENAVREKTDFKEKWICDL